MTTALLIVALILSCVSAFFAGNLAGENAYNKRWWLLLINVITIVLSCAGFGLAASVLLR
jgi:hypothetical protein